MGFSRQEYWSGLPFPLPGELPEPEIKPLSPALQVILYPLSHWGNPYIFINWASLVAQMIKNLLAMQETQIPSLALEDPLEKEKATNSSILVWRIPWTVYSMGLQRVGHD